MVEVDTGLADVLSRRAGFVDDYGVAVLRGVFLNDDCIGSIRDDAASENSCGLSGSDGLIEIKTKLPKLQIDVILDGIIPKEHVVQCQVGLWISERDHIDFASFWPGMPLFHKRAGRDEAMIRKLAERAKTFYEVMEERTQQIIDLSV